MKNKFFPPISRLTLLDLAFLLVLAASLAFVQTARAQDSQPGAGEGYATDNDVNAIAKQLYCPVCPNTPLDVCETKACEDWRAQIKDQLNAGWSQQQVIDYFVAQYGERVLAEPRGAGFNSLVWMLPVMVVIFGLGFIGRVLKSWRTNQAPPPAQAPAPEAEISPDLLAKLEKEIQELD